MTVGPINLAQVITGKHNRFRRAFEAMLDGKLNCTVECSPLLGPQLFEAVQNLMAGKELPRRIVTKEGVFPQEVAREVLPTRKY